MFGRVNDFINRIELGKTYRYPRQIAGKVTGVFFFFGTICQIPMKNYMGGMIAVAVTSLSGIYSFVTKAKENYDASDPGIVDRIRQIEEEHKHNSMYLILKELHVNRDKSRSFLKENLIYNKNIDDLDSLSKAELEEFCLHLFNGVYNTFLKTIEKYSASIINSAEEVAGNYLELMLAKTYAEYAPFDLNEGLSPRNISFLTISLLAVYQGYQTFMETKNSYEKPTPALLTNSILVAFNKHQPSAHINESTPLLAVAINHGNEHDSTKPNPR